MKKKSTLYLSRNGLLEPLGQSQVFAYLRGLSRNYNITLITYEKDEDWADKARLQKARTDCKDLGIRWLPQHFRQQPKIVAPAFSMIRMVWLVRREIRQRGIRLIHARSNIPAATALAVSWMTGVPFLFDLRSLFPEELITARRMRRGSFLHRAIIWAERVCLAKSAAVISQTHAAVNHIKSVYPNELKDQCLVMIPTCADLDRFTPPLDQPSGPTVHGCIGTILSGWFRTDWLAAWLSAVAQNDTDARFEIVTRDDADRVRVALDPMNKFGDRLTIGPRPSEEMPAAVRGHDLTVMFYAGGEVSELGRSPTRMAEVLGCGLPVVANEGVGDVADIIRRYNVGVVVKDGSQAAMMAALDELKALRSDPDLTSRCRKAAKEVFSLQAGTEAYCKLYANILGPSRYP